MWRSPQFSEGVDSGVRNVVDGVALFLEQDGFDL